MTGLKNLEILSETFSKMDRFSKARLKWRPATVLSGEGNVLKNISIAMNQKDEDGFRFSSGELLF
jgi:hypothetical protein